VSTGEFYLAIRELRIANRFANEPLVTQATELENR
jgi:hypothetical protein